MIPHRKRSLQIFTRFSRDVSTLAQHGKFDDSPQNDFGALRMSTDKVFNDCRHRPAWWSAPFGTASEQVREASSLMILSPRTLFCTTPYIRADGMKEFCNVRTGGINFRVPKSVIVHRIYNAEKYL